MVEIFRALRTFLLADPAGFDALPVDERTRRDAARTAIVAAVGTRVYPVKLPQGALTPAIVITKITGHRVNVLNGPASLAWPRYQIDCWVRETTGATSYTTAQDIGGAVLARLEAYQGLMSDPSTSPVSQYRVGVVFDDAHDDFEPDVNGGYHRASADYFIWHGVSAV